MTDNDDRLAIPTDQHLADQNVDAGGKRTGLEIAVIGMSGRFPEAPTIDAFWENLRDGIESVRIFTDEQLERAGVDRALLSHPHYVKSAPVLDATDCFDAQLFDYSPREAEAMDPQQRLFLECAWAALDHAGYNTETHRCAIGVYAGVSMSTYLVNLYSNRAFMDAPDRPQMAVVLGNDKDFVSTRVSYKLNLEGPSLTVQSACSTSLVAVHLACQGLLSGECDIALAGGASVRVPQEIGYMYVEGAIASPDGHCRAFDARAQGTILGSGVGVVVLKRLEDALADGDTIHALITGSATNNDGALKVSYTAPSVEGQAKVIRAAQAMAEVDPATITYIEAHGTGTVLGDPIEIAALTQAFRARTANKEFCAIGSVKTNIGHLDAASGVAGLIKTVLALKHQQLPPSLNFERPNPAIDFANSPFYVNAVLSDWPANGGPRRAGVSSFGIGGTNAHVILEEAPPRVPGSESRPWQLLLLSARSGAALDRATADLTAQLRRDPDLGLADVAYTLKIGRRTLEHHRMLVCRDREDALGALESGDPERVFSLYQEAGLRPVAFLFSGQGAQYVRMAADLYRDEPAFRAEIDRCATILMPHLGLDLRAVLYPEEPSTENRELEQTQYAQPALFIIEYALAQLWMSWGVQPQALIGHSIGEYVAACLAGVFTLEDALALVAARGRLMQSLPGGAMLAVPLAESELRPLLGDQLALAAINGPALCVVSGPVAAVEDLERHLSDRNLACQRLHTSHAFHSAMVDPILEAFAELVGQVPRQAPQLPYLSNVTGTWVTAEQATDPHYWASHLRATVRFGDGLRELLQEPGRVLLEIGPGRTLCTLARQHPDWQPTQTALPSLRHPRDQQPDLAFLLNTLGRLVLAGVKVDWASFYAGEDRRRVPLPAYPFERQRYWVERQLSGVQLAPAAAPDIQQPTDTAAAAEHATGYARPSLPNAYIAPRNEVEETIAGIWQAVLGIDQIGVYDNFHELGGHSLLVTQVAARLREAFVIDAPLREIFETQTIASQALVMIEVLAGQQVDEDLASMLAEIEQLAPDEVQALLEDEATFAQTGGSHV